MALFHLLLNRDYGHVPDNTAEILTCLIMVHKLLAGLSNVNQINDPVSRERRSRTMLVSPEFVVPVGTNESQAWKKRPGDEHLESNPR